MRLTESVARATLKKNSLMIFWVCQLSNHIYFVNNCLCSTSLVQLGTPMLDLPIGTKIVKKTNIKEVAGF